MNFELSKITPFNFMTFFLISIVTVFPGALFFFMYLIDVFLELETVKLLLLSFAVTSPFWLLNSAIYLVLEVKFSGESEQSPHTLQISSMAGSFWSLHVVYLPLMLKMFWDFNVKYAVLSMIIFEVIIAVLIWQFEHRHRRKNA